MKPEKKIKIAFLCSVSPTDKKVWSGTIFRMYEALLNQGYEIEWIPVSNYTAFENRIFSGIETLYKKIFKRGFNKNHFFTKAIIASKKLQKKIKKSKSEIIFAPTTISELAFLKTRKPIIYLNDATYHQLINYYGGMSGFGLISKKTTEIIEKMALQNADRLVFSSDWASNHARDFYKIPENKIFTVKFGSNAGAPDNIVVNKDFSKEIIFLFLAVDWERKGGQIALDAIKILKNRGYNVKLQVVGCVPPVKDETVMNVIPFLNKNNPEEAQKIVSFLTNSHFAFLPTRADCTPISFCEAASYGLPVISTETGGVNAIVENQKTGILLPIMANPENYADEIEKLLNNPQKIQEMSINARKKYDEELNWETWGKEMKKIFDGITS